MSATEAAGSARRLSDIELGAIREDGRPETGGLRLDLELQSSGGLPYPAGHPAASGASGYWGSLNAEEREVLRQFLELTEEKGMLSALQGLGALDPVPEYAALRFLRASKWDVEVAVGRIERHLAWRTTFRFDELLHQQPDAILGCDPADVNRYFPHWQLGFDRQHRPILLKQYGDFEIWNLLELTTMDALLRYHVWFQQKGVEIMALKAQQVGCSIETYTIVLDVAGMGVSQVTRDFLKLVQAIAAIDQDQFPERLGALFIINVPRIFPFIFRGVKPFLDPDVCRKFQIFGSPQEWTPALHAMVDPAGLPPQYGGTGPPLPPFTDVEDVIQDLRQGGTGAAAPSSRPKRSARDLERDSSRSVTPSLADDDVASVASGVTRISDLSFFDAITGPIAPAGRQWFLPSFGKEKTFQGWPGTSSSPTSGDGDAAASRPSACGVLYWPRDRINAIPMMTLGHKIGQLAVFHLFLCGIMIGTVGGALQWAGWTAELVQWVMWVFVVLMLKGILWTMICGATVFAVRHGLSFTSRILSAIYFIGGIVDLSLALACFVLGPQGLDSNINWASVLAETAEGSSKAGILELFRRYYVAIGCVLFLVAIVAFLQFFLLDSYVSKRKRAVRRAAFHTPEPRLHCICLALQETKTVMRLASALSLLFSAVFFGYGGYAVHYAASANFLDPLFTLYMVMVLGAGLSIYSALGFQASAQPSRPLCAALFTVAAAFAVLLISWASVCYSEMSQTGQKVDKAWTTLTLSHGITEDDVSSDTKLTLLVTGSLLLFAGLFMMVHLVAHATALRILSMVRAEDLRAVEAIATPVPKGRLSCAARALLCWAIVTGFFSIFLDGTFAIFSTIVVRSEPWFLSFFIWLGRSDARYINSDSFLVAMNGMLALLGGPLCLGLVLAVVNEHPCQSGLAITAALLQIYTLAMYWATEAHVDFVDMDPHRPGFWIVIFLGDLFRLGCAVAVLLYSFHTLQKKNTRADRLKESFDELRALLPNDVAHEARLAKMQETLETLGVVVEQPKPPAPWSPSTPRMPDEGFLAEYRSPEPGDRRGLHEESHQASTGKASGWPRRDSEARAAPAHPRDFDVAEMQHRRNGETFPVEAAEVDYNWWV